MPGCTCRYTILTQGQNYIYNLILPGLHSVILLKIASRMSGGFVEGNTN